MKPTLLVLFLLMILNADTLPLKGFIRDASNAPIKGATVGLKVRGDMRVSDINGAFDFSQAVAIQQNTINNKPAVPAYIRNGRLFFQISPCRHPLRPVAAPAPARPPSAIPAIIMPSSFSSV